MTILVGDIKNNTHKNNEVVAAAERLQKTIFYGCLSIGLMVGGLTICMPHNQTRRDELNCDALCQGSITSARSFLNLIGASLVGNLSDGGGIKRRKIFLYVGVLGSLVDLVVGYLTFSINGLWLSMVAGSVLSHNFLVMKSIIAECHDSIDLQEQKQQEESKENNSSKESVTRAGSIGKLGMVVGLAFMVGPGIGGQMTKNFYDAARIGFLLVSLSILPIYKIPIGDSRDTTTLNSGANNKNEKTDSTDANKLKRRKNKKPIWSSFRMKPAVLLFMCVRSSMALAFHIFNTAWPLSLKMRFDFGPSDYGMYFSFVGLVYALSQGFIAGRLIRLFGDNRRIEVILLCCICLGVGRWFAFHSQSQVFMYFFLFFTITALGVMNTVITADASKIVSSTELGSLLGMLDSVESGAGMLVSCFVGSFFLNLCLFC